MHPILEKLRGGDRRSIGKSNEVVAHVLEDPALFAVVFEGLYSEDPLLRMRCADVLEKASLPHPEYLAPYKMRLLEEIAAIDQQEVRWHVAQMLPRLELTQDERRRAVEILTGYLADKSNIVKTFSIQALSDLAVQDGSLRPAILQQLETLTATGSPAMQSRGRKLISKLKKGKKTGR